MLRKFMQWTLRVQTRSRATMRKNEGCWGVSFHLMWFLFWYLMTFLISHVASVYVPQIKEVERLRASSKYLDIQYLKFLDVRSGFLGTNKRIQIHPDFPIHQPSMSRRWDAFGYSGPCVWLTHVQEMAIKRTFKVPMGCQGMHKGCPRLYWSLAFG